ncbi:phage tail protein [Burkholderia cepacia]|uniref:phage tail tip lysozyme n=1 Tax=Burkholderia cepacia TaxID=292 RepID=UPI00075ADAD3|nr:phage tail tip lysozyme [Burkholderia cepacia]KVR68583.1 phage tail protein [Burkholderia cepacia]
MASKISISIVGRDQASEPINRVRQSVQRLGSQIKNSRIDRLGGSITTGLSSSGGAISEIARFVGGAGVIGGVTALTVKIAQLEAQWASSVRSMNNLGIRSGLPTGTAYGVQYAARLAGLSPKQANAGIEQVRQSYSDALNNRNPEALKRFQKAGISTDSSRMESLESVLTKLAAYSEDLRKQGKYGGAQNFINAVGAGSLVDFLNRGPQQVAADLRAAKAYIPTEDDKRRALEYAEATAKLGITYERLRNTVMSELEPGFNALLQDLQRLIDSWSGRQLPKPTDPGGSGYHVRDGFEKFGNWMRGNGLRTNAELGQKTSVGNGIQLEQARSMVEWYVNHGLSREHAIGMVADSSRESGLEPRAVGDNGKAVGLFQWHPDRQALYEKTFGRPLALATREEQMAFSLFELKTTEARAGRALRETDTSSDAAATISRMYLRPKDPNEANVRADIARGLDSELSKAIPPLYERAPTGNQGDPTASGKDEHGSASASSGVDQGKVRIEIVHKNPPAGTSATVTSSPNVETEMRTDRQQAALGDQYAYSPGNF